LISSWTAEKRASVWSMVRRFCTSSPMASISVVIETRSSSPRGGSGGGTGGTPVDLGRRSGPSTASAIGSPGHCPGGGVGGPWRPGTG
jgi:hypothetical protein